MPRHVGPAATAVLLALFWCFRVVFSFLPVPHLSFTMSLEQNDENPFNEFALGASPSGCGPIPGVARARPAAARLLMDSLDSKPVKKMRTSTGAKGQITAKGLVEKYSRSPGEPEWPLRLIIVGHNPSEKAWELGHYYGNPSNRMWKLLSSAGIIPPGFTASNDEDCPITSGVGFTDVGFSIPGTVSSEFGKKELHSWRRGFYDRLTAHAERAAATVAASKSYPAEPATERGTDSTSAAGKRTDQGVATGALIKAKIEDGCPRIIAFAGKRQWEELFFDASAKDKAKTKGGKTGPFRFGLQPADLRPPGWPFPAERTEMFVVPSSSGAAAMTNEARETPYRDLGQHMLKSGGEWTHRRGQQSGGGTSSGESGATAPPPPRQR
ncbi:unnamed protein product [Ectocarpus sp. 6 AP-2014]